MNKKLFEKAVFNYAWELPKTIRLFGKEYNILVSADAYYETEEITDAQNLAYMEYLDDEVNVLQKVENILEKESGDRDRAIKRFVPKTLKIKKDGNYGLLFDDASNVEDGLVVTIKPEIKVLTLDEYL